MKMLLPWLAAWTATLALAAPEVSPLASAGKQPTASQAQAAILAWVRKTAQHPKDAQQVRFLSGPHLVTGITFAGEREQAWQMCTILGEATLSHASPSLTVKPLFLRNTPDGVQVLSAVNWKHFDNKC